MNGRIKVGLNEREIQELSNPEKKAVKISRRDFPFVLSNVREAFCDELYRYIYFI